MAQSAELSVTDKAFGRSKKLWAGAAFAMIPGLTGCTSMEPALSIVDPVADLSSPEGYTGRIRLSRFLDEPDGYCMDVPGPPNAPMLHLPVVAHTCHPDPYIDQVFQFNKDESGLMRWTTEGHDLCFTVNETKIGSRLGFKTCDQPAFQTFNFTARGEFKLSGTDLCLHVERTGPALRAPVAEGQDAYGRGRSVNPQFTHLMRFVELRECGDGDASMWRWQAIE